MFRGAVTHPLDLLALQLAWGADEAIGEAPVDRARAPGRAEAAGLPPTPVARPEQAAPSAPVRNATPELGTVTPLRQAGPATPPVARAMALAEAADSLDALRAAMAAFDGLSIRETATNLVFADGNPSARVMLVGEAPGEEEDAQGRPFVGRSGRLLDRMLASIGLDRSSVYITNIVVWRPPGNRTPSDAEVAMSLPFTQRHIALVRPGLVVPVGAIAARALLRTTEGITRIRGRWHALAVEGMAEPIASLPMLHPAYLLRQPQAKALAWRDLVALRRRLDELG